VIDGRPPPTPERIARWEEHAVRLLAVRTAPDRVVDALRHIGCPQDLAQEIVARSRAPATSALRRKGVGILLTGLGMIAASIAATVFLASIAGAHAGIRGRLLWLLILGIGTAVYGLFQIVFG
jgi:hypothetical protein